MTKVSFSSFYSSWVLLNTGTPSFYQLERGQEPSAVNSCWGSPPDSMESRDIVPVVLARTHDSSAHCSGLIGTFSPWVLPPGCASLLGFPIVFGLSCFFPLWAEDASFP